MTHRRVGIQEDLFESSKSQELRQRVKELDLLISKALKQDDYDRAKEYTEQQKRFIQELVEMGEAEIND